MEDVERTLFINEVIEKWCGNGMAYLKKMCDPIIAKFGGLSEIDYDDFYSSANETVWLSMMKYDPDQNDNVDCYIRSCCKKKFMSIITERNRSKRIPSNIIVSLDAALEPESSITIGDMIPADRIVDDDIYDLNGEYDLNEFLNSLSKKQRSIVSLIMDGYDKANILEILGITSDRYDVCMSRLKNVDTLILLNRKS